MAEEMAKRVKVFAKKKKEVKKKANRTKVTLYLDLDHILLMDEIRAKRLKAGASLSAVEKSRLMREALDLLGKKEGLEGKTDRR